MMCLKIFMNDEHRRGDGLAPTAHLCGRVLAEGVVTVSHAQAVDADSRDGDEHSSDEDQTEKLAEEEEEDKEEKEPKIRETPEDILFESGVNTVAFHPTREILAAGDLDGDIYVYEYSCIEGGNKELWSSGHHLKSCREVAFSHDGQKLFSISKDKSIHLMDVEQGKLVSKIAKAHSSSINSLLLIDENLFATGDDNGMLKVWDLRKGTSFMEMKQHEDYISDITIDLQKKILLTTSGDGTMGVFNIKRRRFELSSEFQNGDLTSVAIMKHGKKVACGSSEGMIYLFNWDEFGATSDRFAVRAESVDCILPITDSILCAASIDGVIRAINLFPNRVIGSIGQHVGEPIEQITKSFNGQFLASCAHDKKVKFWDISSLSDIVVKEYRNRKRKGGNLKSLSKKAVSGQDDFFSDLLEDPIGKKTPHEEKEDSEEDSDSD
ncbi:WD repeat-containing protein 55 isoform X1 [Polypterus senegalus]|uniref:WD repeat-containing protein 55 isoform X1 n=1 Tax=Polypterus senegalus TaxID=55291 RepID=UPI00196596A3|nr:WD repeat-containing protein 55 isoform X1 [Polypterus senegalus]